VRTGDSLPGLVGPEVDQVNPDEPNPHPLQVIAQSAVDCGAIPSYSDVTYYTAARVTTPNGGLACVTRTEGS
jgi:hypothetical protein